MIQQQNGRNVPEDQTVLIWWIITLQVCNTDVPERCKNATGPNRITEFRFRLPILCMVRAIIQAPVESISRDDTSPAIMRGYLFTFVISNRWVA